MKLKQSYDYKLIRLARCSSPDGFIQNYGLNNLDKERIIKINIILKEIKELSNDFNQQEIINKVRLNHEDNYDLCEKIFHILNNDPINYNPVAHGLSSEPILIKKKQNYILK